MGEFKCSQCGHEASVEATTALSAESRLVMQMTPAPGERFALETVGEVMANAARLFKSMGADVGMQSMAILDSFKIDDAGAIAFEFTVARFLPEIAPAQGKE